MAILHSITVEWLLLYVICVISVIAHDKSFSSVPCRLVFYQAHSSLRSLTNRNNSGSSVMGYLVLLMGGSYQLLLLGKEPLRVN